MTTAVAQDVAASLEQFVSSEQQPWNLRRVVHLHRRAGFAGTWRELQRDLADGPGPSIDRILNGGTRIDGVAEDFTQAAHSLSTSATSRKDATSLKACWIYRMLCGPDPLGERLTLMWHNYFATSNAKVGDLEMMLEQNDSIRRLARKEFSDPLSGMMRDPALLISLDAALNQRGSPNENLARELMELFTLGVGNYSEQDVREAARALTGWQPIDKFRQTLALHDLRQKKVLDRGISSGQDLIGLLVEQPATATRLAARLCDNFMGEVTTKESLVTRLADGLRSHRLDIGWGVETILRSRAFFADDNIASRVSGPVEQVVSVARALEMFDGSISTLELAQWATAMGQDLYYPPNVGGWEQGRAWLSPRTMVHRMNFATELMSPESAKPFDALGLAEKHGQGGDEQTAIRFFGQLLFGTPPSEAWLDCITADLDRNRWSSADRMRRSVAHLLASAQAQLG